MVEISATIWLLVVLWIGLLAFSRRGNLVGAASGIVGIFLGMALMSLIGPWIGIVLIFLNLYLMYKAIFDEQK